MHCPPATQREAQATGHVRSAGGRMWCMHACVHAPTRAPSHARRPLHPWHSSQAHLHPRPHLPTVLVGAQALGCRAWAAALPDSPRTQHPPTLRARAAAASACWHERINLHSAFDSLWASVGGWYEHTTPPRMRACSSWRAAWGTRHTRVVTLHGCCIARIANASHGAAQTCLQALQRPAAALLRRRCEPRSRAT